MPKLPHVSGVEAVRALQRLGFEMIRQKGSHIVMRRGPSGCIVPNHRGTLNTVKAWPSGYKSPAIASVDPPQQHN
jgi:predicted RNA binding protein YcfA (HicA-like mRNA interferase family)